MTKPTRADAQEQQDRTTGFFIRLGENIVQVAILSALVAGGVIAFLVQDINRRQPPPAVQDQPKREQTMNDRLERRYRNADCEANPICRLQKRIHAEGGASEEAVRKNMLDARSITFEQLEQNAAQYEGTPWAFEGKVISMYQEKKTSGVDTIWAEIIIEDDPARRVSVHGDFSTGFDRGDRVFVVGYLTGKSDVRRGPPDYRYQHRKVISLSARAMLKPHEARRLMNRSGTS